MGRRTLLSLTLAGAIAALLGALLLPVHLRALNPRVIAEGNPGGKSLIEAADDLARRNPAAGKIILRAAEDLHLEGTEAVLEILREGAGARPVRRTVLQELEAAAAGRIQVQETPVLSALRPKESRERLAQSLRTPDAGRVLRNRELTNFTLFAPAKSGAGFPLDAAILTTAFLIEHGAFGANARTEGTLKDEVLQLTARGASASQSEALEEHYLNMLALAKRFSSEQVSAFVSNIQSYRALDRLTRFLQEQPEALPAVFASVVLSRDGNWVAEYLGRYPKTGPADLSLALGAGVRGLNQVLSTQKPVYRVRVHNALLSSRALSFAADPLLRFAIAAPALAHVAKWILLFLAGLALAWAARLARQIPPEEKEGAWVPQFVLGRRAMFAGVFLALAVLLGEPYLAQGQSEDKTPPPRVTFPLFSAATPPQSPPETKTTGFMVNTSTLIAMAVFLILQSSIYVFCLTKLAEIRKQPLSGPMKLRLLENEENLFDAGLYLGLFGTAGSLILLTVGLIKPSLVAAYSSTLFGILFVALLKIVHVRPYKRQLIIETPGETA